MTSHRETSARAASLRQALTRAVLCALPCQLRAANGRPSGCASGCDASHSSSSVTPLNCTQGRGRMHALMRRRSRSHRGFSLTELAVVMAIVAILLAIGVPNYRYITNSYPMSAEVNGLLGDLQFARSEAIKEGRTVTACVSRDGATCDAGSTTWQEGWIVFQDANNDQTVDPGDAVLRVQGTFAGTDT